MNIGEENMVSEDAVVTEVMERYIQVTCEDLPEEHHNRTVNVARYPEDPPLETRGKIIYRRDRSSGLLVFIEEQKHERE